MLSKAWIEFAWQYDNVLDVKYNFPTRGTNSIPDLVGEEWEENIDLN